MCIFTCIFFYLIISRYEEQRKNEETRQENIRKVIAAKVIQMRESQIPEHVIRDVERQLSVNSGFIPNL